MKTVAFALLLTLVACEEKVSQQLKRCGAEVCPVIERSLIASEMRETTVRAELRTVVDGGDITFVDGVEMESPMQGQACGISIAEGEVFNTRLEKEATVLVIRGKGGDTVYAQVPDTFNYRNIHLDGDVEITTTVSMGVSLSPLVHDLFEVEVTCRKTSGVQ